MLGDSLRRSHAPPRQRPEPKPRGRLFRLAWWQWILAGLGVVAASFLVGYLLSVFVLFPAPDTAGTGIAVPELYALEWAEAQERIQAVGLAVGRVTELASLEAPEGEVMAQDPVPGQQLRPGGEVQLVVSAGPPALAVPPVAGLSSVAARELLEEAGFEVGVTQVQSLEPEGVVTGVEPAPGTPQPLPAVVTLLVSVGPPPDSVQADTLRTDTLPRPVDPGFR